MKSVLALLAAGVSTVTAADWAVLVAGSNTYGNYRHQADIAHAYQVVKDNGIPDERVIVMMYDDIAGSSQNPYPGQMFNKPTEAGTPGVDVYAGVKKDYTGADVTPENFLAILTGDSTTTGGKPVLKSTKDDRVFINFSDHGGTGIIAFPSTLLHAADLNKALATGYSKGMWSKAVFYLEACESGSMFEGIIDPANKVYVTTASSATESSWGTYCPPDDMINGKAINSCLGDLYSVNWMENVESVGPTETLADQYTAIKASTTKSAVKQYGDMDFLSDPIGDYVGDKSASNLTKTEPTRKSRSDVSSRDIPLHLAYYQYLRADKQDYHARQALAAELSTLLTSQMKSDEAFFKLSKAALNSNLLGAEEATLTLFNKAAPSPAKCGACCMKLTSTWEEQCGGFDDYNLKYIRVIHNVCNHVEQDEAEAARLAGVLQGMCQ